MQPHRVLVVGGGYAGVLVATRIARKGRRRVAVTLVNEGPDFVERVRLSEYLCSARQVAHDLRSALGPDVRFVVGRVVALDRERSRAVLAGGQEEAFDTCVVATGSGPGDGAVPGARAHACNISTLASAAAARRRLAAAGARARILICGGGLTAIELAAELAEAHPTLAIALVTAGTLGSGLSSRGRRVVTRHLSDRGVALHERTPVRAVDARGIVHEGGRMDADVVLWCAGLEASGLPRALGLAIDDGGRALVDDFLRSTSHPNVVVVGDSAAIVHNPIRMGCVAALPMAIHAADGVARAVRGRALEPFRFRFMIQCISLGRRSGLLQFVRADDSPKERVISGRAAAVVKELICRYAARRPFREHPRVPAELPRTLSAAEPPRHEAR